MSARILLLDVERLPGQAEITFWDLSDYRNRRIHADNVTQWPRTICAAWKWRDNPRIDFAAEWEDENWLQSVWEAYDQADIVIGHNLDGFDTPKLNGEWLLGEYGEPSPYKTVDTLRVARRKFGFESNTLKSLCERLGVPTKVDKYDPFVAQLAVDGNAPAQRRIKRYNKGDVTALEALYGRMLGWIPNHPQMGLYTDGVVCTNCGKSGTLTKQGTRTVVAMRQSYQQYLCKACGKWNRGAAIVNRIEMPK